MKAVHAHIYMARYGDYLRQSNHLTCSLCGSERGLAGSILLLVLCCELGEEVARCGERLLKDCNFRIELANFVGPDIAQNPELGDICGLDVIQSVEQGYFGGLGVLRSLEVGDICAAWAFCTK